MGTHQEHVDSWPVFCPEGPEPWPCQVVHCPSKLPTFCFKGHEAENSINLILKWSIPSCVDPTELIHESLSNKDQQNSG